MALLRNISGSVKKVGGWQKRLTGNALFEGAHGTAMVLPVDLQPGETIEVPREALDDHIVVKLAQSTDFELIDVENVAGGRVISNPNVPAGKVCVLRRTLTAADLGALAGGVTSQAYAMGTIPAGTVVVDALAEIKTAEGTIANLDLNLGDDVGFDNLVADADGNSVGLQRGALGLLLKDLPSGMVVTLVADGNGTDLNTSSALSLVILVMYTVL